MSHEDQNQDNIVLRKEKEEMKNTFLKKAGAVALAAVMAVTFAPVASLNVFAAVAKDGKLVTGDTEIEKDGTYTVSDSGITVAVSGGAHAVTMKPNKKGVTISSNNATESDAVLNVSGNAYQWTDDEGYTVDEITLKNVTSFSAINLSGNLKVTTKDKTFASKFLNKAFGTEPVVVEAGEDPTTATTYYIGSKAIDTLAADKSIEAVNGTVKVSGLASGKYVKVSDKANRGTSVTATAADDTSLVKATTTYTYRFTSTDAADRYGTAVWTDTQYAAGKKGLEVLENAGLTAPTAGKDNYLSETGIRADFLAGSVGSTKQVTSIKYYDRAIELTQNDKDKFEKGLHVNYADECDYDDDNPQTAGEFGITYFTKDPSSYMSDKDGLTLIDGTKYVINETGISNGKGLGQLEVASMAATKSLKVIKGTSQSGNAVDDYDTIHPQTALEVSGPTSSSIVIAHYTTVGTKHNETKNIGYVYGANHVEGVNGSSFFTTTIDSAALSNKIVSTELEVPQVAANTFILVRDAYADTVATPGTGVTYYYEQGRTQLSGNKADFVFGSSTVVDNALKMVLSGQFNTGANYFTKAKSGEKIFVAKGVKDTFKNVEPLVTVVGEISQDSEKQSDGYFTWTVNTGTAESIDHVNAYRMYRASGEHVYTINPDEVTLLVNAGWKNEGVAFKVNSVASKKGTPIYRVYNKNNGGMHFYTASAAEKDMLLANGWTEGAVVFYGADKATGIPVYRTYNTGSNNGEHNYTTNIAESDMNVKAGWRAEGVAFYVFK